MTDDEIQKTSGLFSENYGIWSDASPYVSKRGKKIIFSPKQITNEFVLKPDRYVIMAYVNEELAGHIFYLKRKGQKNNPIIFVLQLVVAKKFRNHKLATRMMTSIWQQSNCYAWGLFTSNPKTIKVLEQATLRTVNPKLISQKIDRIKEVVYDVFKDMAWINNYKDGVVATDFYVDHSSLNQRIKKMYPDNDFPYSENLPEGTEWLAFTFKSQKPMFSSEEEWQKYLDYSQEDIITAYSNMKMSDQGWAKHTIPEIDYLTQKYISKQDYILDFGCGIGRHTIELDKRGYSVLGVDFSQSNINKAINTHNKNIFTCKDIRKFKSRKKADVVLCLYDVIGSFPKQLDNIKILKSARKALKPGGKIILSVMNMELTQKQCKNIINDVKDDIGSLLSLPPSYTMQNSGDIFDGSKILIERSTGLVYRKEQFNPEDSLPCELIIRDRRYTLPEIQRLLYHCGFDIIETFYFQAGKMDRPLHNTHKKAKEILVVAQKNSFIKKLLLKYHKYN